MKNKKKDREKRQGANVNNKRNRKGSPQKTSAERTSIFSAMESEKIKHLFDEIKKAEAKRGDDQLSDDDMSEGSSDG